MAITQTDGPHRVVSGNRVFQVWPDITIGADGDTLAVPGMSKVEHVSIMGADENPVGYTVSGTTITFEITGASMSNRQLVVMGLQ